MEPLLSWARSRGASYNDAVLICREGSRGRGVFATEVVPKGTLLMRLPFELAVRPNGLLAERVEQGKCSSLLALALTAYHEAYVAQPRSPFFDVFVSTPPPRLPMLWSEAELALLPGTSLLPADSSLRPSDLQQAARSAFANDVLPEMEALGDDYIPLELRCIDKFMPHLALVVSRTLQGRVSYEHGAASLWPCLAADGPSTSTRQGGPGPFLLPIFELLNHSSDPDACCTRLTRVDGDAVDGSTSDVFEIRAERTIRAGEEILHSYGRHGSAELLRTYGFIEAGGSPHTGIFLGHATLVTAAAAQLARSQAIGSPVERCTQQSANESKMDVLHARLEMLSGAGLLPPGGFVLTRGTLVPVPLLTSVQVLLMEAEAYEAWCDAGCISLGEEFLDADILPEAIACLLSLVRASVSPSGGSSSGRGGTPAGGKDVSTEAAALAEALRIDEARIIRAFKSEVLGLEDKVAANAVDDDEELTGEESDREESDGEESEGQDGAEFDGQLDEESGDGDAPAAPSKRARTE